MDSVTQALQMLKEHPTYKDDDEIKGNKRHVTVVSIF